MDAKIENKKRLHTKSIFFGSKCEMANCRNNLKPSWKKSYFRFPKVDYYCSEWVFACARIELVDLFFEKGSEYFYKTRKVCEDHFIKENFRNPSLLSQGLIQDVIPTKNLPELKTMIHIRCEDGSKINIDKFLAKHLSKETPLSELKSIMILRKTINSSPNTGENNESKDKTNINIRTSRLVKNLLRKSGRPRKCFN